jgi:pilus assembly protein CpaB
MNPAGFVFWGVAPAAGGAAMFLVNNASKIRQPIVQSLPAPAPQVETDDVLTAARELGVGTLITENDLAWTAWPRAALGAGMIRRSEQPNVVADLKGAVSRGSFFQGEPIRREKLVKGPNSGFMSAILPSGARAVAINIDTQGATSAGGFILPNDHVDVVRTYRDEEAGKASGADAYTTETLLSNVRVLAIGQNVQEKNGERVVVGSNATLEVDPHQAEVLILAQRVGQLSLVLRSMLDAAQTPDTQPDEPEKKGMTVIRYGVPTNIGKR